MEGKGEKHEGSAYAPLQVMFTSQVKTFLGRLFPIDELTKIPQIDSRQTRQGPDRFRTTVLAQQAETLLKQGLGLKGELEACGRKITLTYHHMSKRYFALFFGK